MHDIIEDWNDKSFDTLCGQYQGCVFRDLVQHHLRRFRRDLPTAIYATIAQLTPDEKKTVEALVDEYNNQGYRKALWSDALATTFRTITERYAELHRRLGDTPVRRSAMFHAFTVVVQNFGASGSCVGS